MSKVWDCFLFLHETELLELRLHTLRDVVNEFVLIETEEDFGGRSKPSYFLRPPIDGPLPPTHPVPSDDGSGTYRLHGCRVRRHLATLPPIAPDGPFPIGGRWPREIAMRNAIADVLRPIAQPQDYILISDVDEIPDPKGIQARHAGVFLQALYVYQLNAYFADDWKGSVGCPYHWLSEQTPHGFRAHNAQLPRWKGGWHFSYMGTAETRRRKVMAGGDAAFDTDAVLAQLEERAARLEDPMGRPFPAGLQPGRLVPLDDSFPPYIRAHPERFPGWIGDCPA